MQKLLNFGVDVAKDAVVAGCNEQGAAVRSIPNQRTALVAWLASLPSGSRIGMEATGCYHELLADLAHQSGHTVFVLNPKDTRHYAQAVGLRAKTDRVDAVLIARLVAHEHTHLHPYHPATRAQRQLGRLLRRRAQLVKLKGALKQSMKGMTGLARDTSALVERMDALIAKLEQGMDALIASMPGAQEDRRKLETINGVGPVVSAALIEPLTRVPFRSSDAFVAFAGLDPRPRDSGRKAGKRRLSKRGPAELRRLLFNAAMSATRTDVWKPVYEHYRAHGLPTTAALVIIARKIARIAWSIQRYHTSFDPQRLKTP
jgi:transposase